MEKVTNNMFYAIGMLLMAIASVTVTTSSAFMWHEPDCPKELLK